ncbi:MAG: hypothetical protein IJ767_07855 [Bacteroidaceae bacterium]|nr:hypothetical protein [Alloprevotella sp.]MBR1801382.1 hypothetical protein [Bacteroidaceae bacterium]
MNNGNLIHLSSREARENGSKGGKSSVETRRRKKLLKELAEIIGQAPLTEEEREHLLELGIPEKELCKDFLIVVALYEKAAKGDVQAFNAIRDIKGEKPRDEVATDIPNSIRVEIVGDNGMDFPRSEEEVDEERDPRYMIHRE